MRVLLSAVLAVALVGCGTATGDGDAPDGELLVFAAASLTDAFETIADAFQAQHPDLDVVVHVAGSQRLAAQILEGAPAAVFASADDDQMARVVASGATAGPPRTFARNELAIAVAPGNPHGITGPDDLARDDLTVVVADDAVPVGAYTERVLDAADVSVSPASRELDVRAVLSRVALGEADAGVVYASDLHGRGDVAGVPIPEAIDVTASYPIVALEGAHPAADRFVEFVLSDEGARILRAAGFATP